MKERSLRAGPLLFISLPEYVDCPCFHCMTSIAETKKTAEFDFKAAPGV